MSSKANSKNRDNGRASSSISNSPYNLRRYQTQSGFVTKGTSSAKPKKNTSVVISRTSSNNTNSSTAERASNLSQLSSSDDEQPHDGSESNEMERSDEDQEASMVKQHNERQSKKHSYVRVHFDQLDENVYMCRICLKVSKHLCKKILCMT